MILGKKKYNFRILYYNSMGLFDFFSNYGLKMDATIHYDARRNLWHILITSNKEIHINKLEIEISKLNDYDDWVLDYLDDINYNNPEGDSTTEYKTIHLDLTPGLPMNVDFTLEIFKRFTLESLEKYFHNTKEHDEYEKERIKEFREAFLDPNWKMIVKADTILLWSYEFLFEKDDIKEFVSSLNA